MNKRENEFRLQIAQDVGNITISGDIVFNIRTNEYTAKLHNNGREFIDSDSNKAILKSFVSWFEIEI